jgi:hypothetical protein
MPPCWGSIKSEAMTTNISLLTELVEVCRMAKTVSFIFLEPFLPPFLTPLIPRSFVLRLGQKLAQLMPFRGAKGKAESKRKDRTN